MYIFLLFSFGSPGLVLQGMVYNNSTKRPLVALQSNVLVPSRILQKQNNLVDSCMTVTGIDMTDP